MRAPERWRTTVCGRRAEHGRDHCATTVDNSPSSTESQRVSSRGLGNNGDNPPSTIHALRSYDDGLSTIHSTYYHHCLVRTLHEEKGGTVKFRCEREILADALATAGRAATSRTGTLPVLSGVRLDVVGDELTVTGTDLELTIRLTVPVGGEHDGSVVVPARLVADIVKALPSGAVEVVARRRRDEHQRRTVAVLGAATVAR